ALAVADRHVDVPAIEQPRRDAAGTKHLPGVLVKETKDERRRLRQGGRLQYISTSVSSWTRRYTFRVVRQTVHGTSGLSRRTARLTRAITEGISGSGMPVLLAMQSAHSATPPRA